jgi:hypothetical protein
MYEKWFIANQKCKQHLIVPFKEITLVSWGINTVSEDHHYSDNLSVVKEGFIYVVKYEKNLIENSKRGTSSLVYQYFLMIGYLITVVEDLNVKLLAIVRFEYLVWG